MISLFFFVFCKKNAVLLFENILLGTVSLKLLGGKSAPKLVYFVLRKELLNL